MIINYLLQYSLGNKNPGISNFSSIYLFIYLFIYFFLSFFIFIRIIYFWPATCKLHPPGRIIAWAHRFDSISNDFKCRTFSSIASQYNDCPDTRSKASSLMPIYAMKRYDVSQWVDRGRSRRSKIYSESDHARSSNIWRARASKLSTVFLRDIRTNAKFYEHS